MNLYVCSYFDLDFKKLALDRKISLSKDTAYKLGYYAGRSESYRRLENYHVLNSDDQFYFVNDHESIIDVINAISSYGEHSIKNLYLSGHGDAGEHQLCKRETINLNFLQDNVNKSSLNKLGNLVARGGKIIDLGCHVARGNIGQAYCAAFAKATEVPFCSTEFWQIIGYDRLIGRYSIFFPEGRVESHVDPDGFLGLSMGDEIRWSIAVGYIEPIVDSYKFIKAHSR